jgi:hypothetical protein
MEKMLILFGVAMVYGLIIGFTKSTVDKSKLLYPAVIILGLIFLVKGVWGSIEIFPLLTQEPTGVGLPINDPTYLPANLNQYTLRMYKNSFYTQVLLGFFGLVDLFMGVVGLKKHSKKWFLITLVIFIAQFFVIAAFVNWAYD